LGATATRAIVGPDVKVTETAGRVLRSPYCERTIATLHPSAVLRARDEALEARRARLVADLALAGVQARARRGAQRTSPRPSRPPARSRSAPSSTTSAGCGGPARSAASRTSTSAVARL